MNNGAETEAARIFVGLKISPEIAARLSAHTAELKGTRARLVGSADIHLTLVPPWREVSIDRTIDRLHRVAGAYNPFSLNLHHLRYGPRPRQPSVLWVDCLATEEMTALRHALMQAFGQEDSRPFRPHVTLARIRTVGQSFLRRHPIDKDLNFTQTVRTVELFRSPPPGAAGYQILASAELGKGTAADDVPTPLIAD